MHTHYPKMITRALQRLIVSSRVALTLRAPTTRAIQLLPVRLRLMHTSRIVLAKMTYDSENITSHSFLVRDPKYQATISPVSKDFYLPQKPLISDEFTEKLANNQWQGDTIVDEFVRISYFARDQGLDITISEPCFDTMVAELINASPSFTYEDLCKVLFCLNMWPPTSSVQSPNFKELWLQLDSVCMTKFRDWSVPQLLLVMDHWYQLSLLRIGKFGRVACRKALRNYKSLSSAELVQMLFYVNVRRVFPDVEVVGLQVHLEKRISALSMEEVGVCAMAFFKTKTRIVSFNLMEMILRKLISNADTAESLTIGCIAKIIRMGLHIGLVPLLHQVFEALYPRVQRGDLSSVAKLHLVLAGTNVQVFHHGLLSCVTENLLRNIKSIRLKELERLALTLQMFRWPKEVPGVTDNLYKFIVNELHSPEREQECNQYPRSFTSLLHYLSVAGLYDYKLADRALSHEFLNVIYTPSVKDSGFEILSLDVGLEVECPDYQGARLKQKSRSVLSKEISKSPYFYRNFPETMDKGSYNDKKLKEVALTMSKVIGPSWKTKMYIGHLLPNFFWPDIALKFSEDCESFEDIPSDFDFQWPGVIKKPDSPNWAVVVYACRSLVFRGDENQVIGSLAMKLRWLEKVGYNCILIPNLEWPGNGDDQIDKIESLLVNCRKSIMSKRQQNVLLN